MTNKILLLRCGCSVIKLDARRVMKPKDEWPKSYQFWCSVTCEMLNDQNWAFNVDQNRVEVRLSLLVLDPLMEMLS